MISRIKNKNDILNLKIDDIECGDLIYDGFLKNYYKYTLDINSEQFHNYLNNFIKLYLFWDNYLNKNMLNLL